jgi:hypothetical protein
MSRKNLMTLLSCLLLVGCLEKPEARPAVGQLDQQAVEPRKFKDAFENYQQTDGGPAPVFADDSNEYGLNCTTCIPSMRQTGSEAGKTYERKSGVWYDDAGTPPKWDSQVNHVFSPGTLSFHNVPSAVVLKHAFEQDGTGAYRLSFVTEPVVGDDRSSSDWTSIMLSVSDDNSGWVEDSGVEFGFLIRSNGGFTIYRKGVKVTASLSSVPANDRYKVSLTVRSNRVTGLINDTWFYADLSETGVLPPSSHVYMGAYFAPGASAVSRFDDLSVSPESYVKHYGYYWAESEAYGSHLQEKVDDAGVKVADYTNLNHVQRVQDVEMCRNAGEECILEVRWEFFKDTNTIDGGDPVYKLRDDYLQAWNATVAEISSRGLIDNIAAFHLIDEPYWLHQSQITPEELDTCIDAIKQSYPDKKIMVVFAAPTLYDGGFSVPVRADWIGIDQYTFLGPEGAGGGVVQTFNKLKSKLHEHQRLFLVPQNKAEPGGGVCEETVDHASCDDSYATINWDYYDLARAEPKVIGMFNFGFWSFIQDPKTLPKTVKAHQGIGRAILGH